MTETAAFPTVPAVAALARCLGCATPLAGRSACPACGRPYPTRGGIFEAIGPLAGRNAVAAAFYDGPGWARFRPWERLFLRVNGGTRRARLQILGHLDLGRPGMSVLEVGVGEGENLRFLPPDWDVRGVDIARTRLDDCIRLNPAMDGRLAWAEAEVLPFPDDSFDACYSVGGFNYFGDHAAAIREMRRVTRPGGMVVVADESPGLHRFGIGHLLGMPAVDAAWLRALGLDRDFVRMIFETTLDVDRLVADAWPTARRLPIWNGLGYCLAGTSGS